MTAARKAGVPLRGREAKLQKLGSKITSTLYMLVRNIRMYAPDNEIFAQPIDALRELINTVFALDHKFELQAAGTLMSLNGYLLRFDFSALENVRFLTNVLREADVGGFSVEHPVQTEDVLAFFRVLAAPKEEAEQLAERLAIKRAKYHTIVETLQNQSDAAIAQHQKIDRKKYALTVYARGIFFLRHFLNRVQAEESLPDVRPATSIVRDLVDLAREDRSHFLGLTSMRHTGDYLPYHLLNTCLLSLVIGAELRLPREHLLDLGKAALFHDIGVSSLDQELLSKSEVLSPEERRKIHLSPLFAAKIMMRGRPLDLAALKCILAAREAKLSYSTLVRNSDGTTAIVPRDNLGVFGRIVRLTSCFDALTSPRPYRDALSPKVAYQVMNSQMRDEFDPTLMQIFATIVAAHKVTDFGDSGASIMLS